MTHTTQDSTISLIFNQNTLASANNNKDHSIKIYLVNNLLRTLFIPIGKPTQLPFLLVYSERRNPNKKESCQQFRKLRDTVASNLPAEKLLFAQV